MFVKGVTRRCGLIRPPGCQMPVHPTPPNCRKTQFPPPQNVAAPAIPWLIPTTPTRSHVDCYVFRAGTGRCGLIRPPSHNMPLHPPHNKPSKNTPYPPSSKRSRPAIPRSIPTAPTRPLVDCHVNYTRDWAARSNSPARL